MASFEKSIPSWLGKAAVALGAIIGTAAVWHWWHKRSNHKYVLVSTLSKITLYPVKSCKGVSLSEAQCGKHGLKSGVFRDREFMVVKSDGHFITARQEPSMVLITPSFHSEQLWLDAPGMGTLKVSKPSKRSSVSSDTKEFGAPLVVTIFGENVSALNCGKEASQWLSQYIGKPGIMLVHFPENTSTREPKFYEKWERFKKTDNAIFADLAPFMLMSESSLHDLNTRLIKNVTLTNFRPTMEIKGNQPYEEELWKYVKIGDISFRNVKPCTRCVLTTVDPETGIKDGIEPLKTLKSYKQLQKPEHRKLEGESPVFGIYMSADVYGVIKVGDPVYAVV